MPTWELKSAADAERIFAAQLKKCRVEYFDFYLAHNMSVPHYKILRETGLYEVLRRKKEEGLIRRLGFSFHDNSALLSRILEDYAWDFAQIQLNYLDWDDCDAKGLYSILSGRGIPVVIMEPVRGGALATLNPRAVELLKAAAPEASPASWAIRYAASLPGVLTVLSGMSSLEQVEDNLRSMEPFKALSAEERLTLGRAAEAYRASGLIPCTGCRYCMDCPSGVDIPRIFSIYNHARPLDESVKFRLFPVLYSSLLEEERAHNCIACGQCAEHCPQSIAIPERLREVAAYAQA
jgi:predicted aldo/keto reductase-like oxidoreductase